VETIPDEEEHRTNDPTQNGLDHFLNVNANYAFERNIFEFNFNTTTTNDPTTYKDIYVAPIKYDDAWNHPDPFQQKKCREAIGKELSKMKEMGVWKKVKRNLMPDNKHCSNANGYLT
jgi:hypothetical protein